MLEAMVEAAQNLFTPGPMIGFLIMVPIALIAGLMPGGGLPFVVVILSFATQMEPYVVFALMIGYMAANDLTEPIPSILLGIPGSRSSQATILDGYPLAKQGKAGQAIGASYTASLIGGIVGAIALLAVLPFARELLKLFGAPEFFLLSLLGIASVGIISAGAFSKGLLTAGLGLFIGMIGFNDTVGMTRATFGLDYLWDGINIIPVVVGLFAFPEIADLVISNTPIAKDRMEAMLRDGRKDTLIGMQQALNHKWLIVRSSLIGVFIGAMPGLGPTPAHWIAYAQARQTEKGAVKTFGTGDIRGVIAPEAANNSTDGGVLIPTLLFAIPGSAPMALVLGALILVGIQPGPQMVGEHLDLTIAMVYIIVLGNIVVVPVVLLFAAPLTRVSVIPPQILAPVVIGITTVSAFMANTTYEDLALVGVFAVLGMFMKAYGWPRPPILIAIVLTGQLEKWMAIAIQTRGVLMIWQPAFIAILVLVGLAVFFSLRVQSGTKERAEEIEGEVSGVQGGGD